MTLLVKDVAIGNGAADSRSLKFQIVRKEAELAPIVALAREAHEESHFGYIPFSEDKVCKIGARAFSQQNRNLVLLATRQDKPLGFAFCSAGEFHIGTGVLLTTIHVAYVSHSIRDSLAGGRVALGLFKAIERWSKAIGAREVVFHVTSGVGLDRAGNTAAHLGFKSIGGAYVASSSKS